MRGPHKVAVAVRQPDGEIAVDVNPVKVSVINILF